MAELRDIDRQHSAAYLQVLRELDPALLSPAQKKILTKERRREEQKQKQEREAREAAEARYRQELERLERERLERERVRHVVSTALPPIDGLLDLGNLSHNEKSLVEQVVSSTHAREVRQLEQDIASLTQTQRARADELQTTQAASLKLDAEIPRLREQVALQQGITPERREAFDREFNRLRLLPGVTSVRFENRRNPREDHFIIRVEPRVEDKGVTYDFGDWELCVYMNGSIIATCRRQGSRNGTVPTLQGQYCLGDRGGVAGALQRRFEILEAVTLYIEGLHALHRYHGVSYRIPDYFSPTNQIPTMKAV